MKHSLIGVFCALVSFPCMAGEWFLIGEAENMIAFADYSSIEQSGNVRGLWYLTVFHRHQKGLKYSLEWAEYDCKSKKYRIRDYADYDKDDRLVNKGISHQEWSRIVPGSIADQALKAICREKPHINFNHDSVADVVDDVRLIMINRGYWK